MLLVGVVEAGGRDAVRGEQGDDVGLGEVEAEGFEGDFELVVVYVRVFVEVEELELSSTPSKVSGAVLLLYV